MKRLSDPEIEELLKKKKIINGTLEWKITSVKDTRKEIFVVIDSVVVESRTEDLIFIADKNKANIFSLNLMIGDNNRQVIRRYDMNIFHTNPDELKPIGEPHKHAWKDQYDSERWAYIPNPRIDNKNANNAIMQFFTECGIEYDGIIQDKGKVQIQRTLTPIFAHHQYEDEDLEDAFHLFNEGDNNDS